MGREPLKARGITICKEGSTMSEKIYVDQDKLNTQMGQLNDALDNIPDYDCTLESSPMGINRWGIMFIVIT